MTSPDIWSPDGLAQLFHETYEALAPSFGYETRKESARPWAEVPAQNKALMTAVASVIIGRYDEEFAEFRREYDLKIEDLENQLIEAGERD